MSAPLERLDPSWLTWLCEASARGATDERLEEVLRERGDPEPLKTLTALRADPIYTWALSRLKEAQANARRAEAYVALHSALWDLCPTPLAREERPDPERFFTAYYSACRPVIISGWAERWRSSKTWSLASWAERFRGVRVHICADRDSEPLYDRRFERLSQEVDLGAFAEALSDGSLVGNDRYLIARNFAFGRPELASLLEDIDEEPYLNPDDRRGSIALWLGPAGTYTPLHHDTCQIMFVQVLGEKHITLIPPHAQSLFDDATNMYSNLPPTRDLSLNPAHPHQLELTLKAGEALFIPVGWWHAVRSLSPSISLAMTHFRRSNRFAWYQPNASALTPYR